MSDQPLRHNWFAVLFLELFKLTPILAAIWISMEANQLSRSQLRSSEVSLQRTYEPVLVAEQPLFNEVVEGGQVTHAEFFARIINLSQNAAHNISAQLFVDDSPILENPVTSPILVSIQTPIPDDFRLRREFAVSVPVPNELALRVLDGKSELKLVFEREDVFGNQLRTTNRYRMDDSGRPPSLKTLESRTDYLGKAP